MNEKEKTQESTCNYTDKWNLKKCDLLEVETKIVVTRGCGEWGRGKRVKSVTGAMLLFDMENKHWCSMVQQGEYN
jgi:hypothetical protein